MSNPAPAQTVVLPPPKITTRTFGPRSREDLASRPQLNLPTAENGTSSVEVQPVGALRAAEQWHDACEALAASPLDLLAVVAELITRVATLPKVAAVAYFLRGSNGSLSLGPNNWAGFVFDREPFRQGLNATCSLVAKYGRMQKFSQVDVRSLVTFCLPIRITIQHVEVLTVSVAEIGRAHV